jgi:alkaline phosphatase D
MRFGLLLVLLVVAPARGELPPHLVMGPLLGHVSSAGANVWAAASRDATLGIRIAEPADLAGARTVEGPKLSDDNGRMGMVTVDGLRPSTRYYYCITLDGKDAMLPPYPSFATAPPDGTPGRQCIAFGSCVGRDAMGPAATWGDMAERVGNVDLLLMLGDNHYADTTDLATQRRYYAEQRKIAGFAQIARRTPVYAIWDDHDYGANNGDSTATGKDQSLKAFKEHWANPAYGRGDDPGVYFKFTRGDVEFFMLDGRYHRTPNKAREDGKKTMLGPRQLEWLKRGLTESKAKVKFVCSPSEWQANGYPDSWRSFLRERKELFDLMRPIEGVILLSGDRHMTSGYHIEGRFIEITSGPLGSKNVLWPVLPETFYNEPAGKLYSVFDVDTTGEKPVIILEVYRASAGMIWRRGFTWDEVNGRAKIPLLPAGIPEGLPTLPGFR